MHFRWPKIAAILAAAFCVAAVGCRTAVVRIERATLSAPAAPPGVFRAGMASVDITPPPGLPSLGFSVTAEHKRMSGHRTRLYARALVLEDPEGDLVGIVVADLGLPSRLLHRALAARVASVTGITADRLLLAATHTHSGPAGYSSSGLYNAFGSPRLFSGHDPRLLKFLVERMSEALEQAFLQMRPAVLSSAQTNVEGLTRNRSIQAFRKNREWGKSPKDQRPLPVDPRLTLLRIDGCDKKPIGALFFFAGHPAVVSPANDLWHADVFGVAVKHLEREAAASDQQAGFASLGGAVFAIANSSEGDVSFRWKRSWRLFEGGHREALRLGAALGREAWTLYRSARELSVPVDIAHRYEEISLPGALLGDGSRKLCEDGYYGASALAGAEEARSGLYPAVVEEGMNEGTNLSHRPKEVALRVVQDFLRWALPFEPPKVAPVQIFRIAGLHLIGLPVEPTTQLARRISSAVAERTGEASLLVGREPGKQDATNVLVLGLANEYMGYCTTEEEYSAQHYEGASTLYGKHEGVFFLEIAKALVRRLPKPGVRSQQEPVTDPVEFSPGWEETYVPDPGSEPVTRRPVDLRVFSDRAVFVWKDLDPGRIGMDQGPLVNAEYQDGSAWQSQLAGWRAMVIDGVPEDDCGLDFEVRLLEAGEDAAIWQATWFFPANLDRSQVFRLIIAPRAPSAELILPALSSAPFQLSLDALP